MAANQLEMLRNSVTDFSIAQTSQSQPWTNNQSCVEIDNSGGTTRQEHTGSSAKKILRAGRIGAIVCPRIRENPGAIARESELLRIRLQRHSIPLDAQLPRWLYCDGSAGRHQPSLVKTGFVKIIRPALLCSTLLTMLSMSRPIMLDAPSQTTMVPSSRYPTP